LRPSLLTALVFVVLVTAHATAQEQELRWKFKPGDKIGYNIVQDSTLSAEGNPAASLNMRQEMDIRWDVAGVNEQGEAVVQQKFERVKLKMTLPMPIGVIELDSKSEAPPMGVAALLAPMIKAITEGTFELTITSRGEVKDVKIPEDVSTVLKNNPNAAALGEMATEEGFKKMLSQGVQLLPEKAAKPGEQWSTQFVQPNPAAGTQTVETIYRFEATKDVDGKKMAVIRPELKLSIEGAAAPPDAAQNPAQSQQPQPAPAKMVVKEQKSEGEVLFDVENGRLSSLSLNYKASIDVAGQGVQNIDQKSNAKLRPVGEAAEKEGATGGAENAAEKPADEKK
jgi:hypothetical protein